MEAKSLNMLQRWWRQILSLTRRAMGNDEKVVETPDSPYQLWLRHVESLAPELVVNENGERRPVGNWTQSSDSTAVSDEEQIATDRAQMQRDVQLHLARQMAARDQANRKVSKLQAVPYAQLDECSSSQPSRLATSNPVSAPLNELSRDNREASKGRAESYYDSKHSLTSDSNDPARETNHRSPQKIASIASTSLKSRITHSWVRLGLEQLSKRFFTPSQSENIVKISGSEKPSRPALSVVNSSSQESTDLIPSKPKILSTTESLEHYRQSDLSQAAAAAQWPQLDANDIASHNSKKHEVLSTGMSPEANNWPKLQRPSLLPTAKEKSVSAGAVPVTTKDQIGLPREPVSRGDWDAIASSPFYGANEIFEEHQRCTPGFGHVELPSPCDLQKVCSSSGDGQADVVSRFKAKHLRDVVSNDKPLERMSPDNHAIASARMACSAIDWPALPGALNVSTNRASNKSIANSKERRQFLRAEQAGRIWNA